MLKRRWLKFGAPAPPPPPHHLLQRNTLAFLNKHQTKAYLFHRAQPASLGSVVKKCWLITRIKWLAGCLCAAKVEGRQDWTEDDSQKRARRLRKCSLWLPARFKMGENKVKRRAELVEQTSGEIKEGKREKLMCLAIKSPSNSRVSWIWFILIVFNNQQQ